ncbi:MAG: D-lyxose/D-mannose family sugar isomerase, partial [Clostridia bacterium]|nr:D-lyxose/D-mannose family sugar isomerase [Clostridia bacterium]
MKEQNITLPSFGYYSPEDWKQKKDSCETIFEVMLGWDVTDFGTNDYNRIGCALFTLRNGSLEGAGVPYAEKYLIFTETQAIPLHFHYMKQEDIINRAGGTMCVEVYASTEDGELDRETDVVVYTDGVRNVVPSGTVIEITTGNSITLTPGLYHRIYVKEGTGALIAGEVSSVNDDRVDNRFYEPTARFCGIEEDEPARYILSNEYNIIG